MPSCLFMFAGCRSCSETCAAAGSAARPEYPSVIYACLLRIQERNACCCWHCSTSMVPAVCHACWLQIQEVREAAAGKLCRWWRTCLHCRPAKLALEVHRQLKAAQAPARQREQQAAGRVICEWLTDVHRAHSFTRAVKLFVARVSCTANTLCWTSWVLPNRDDTRQAGEQEVTELKRDRTAVELLAQTVGCTC